MPSVTDPSNPIADFRTRNPGRFVRVVRLVIENDPVGRYSRQALDLVLRTDEALDLSRLSLHFEGVRDLKIGDVAPGSWCTLAIEDIQDRDWEGLNYSVQDVEGEVVRFYCERFSIRDD